MSEMDEPIEQIASYVSNPPPFSEDSYKAAHLSMVDALGCAILSLSFPACTKLLGPIVPGTTVPNGSRIPGVNTPLDPITASFNLGMMIRWLDFNDTWLAKEWGHPSDNMGAILAVGDHLSQSKPIPMRKIYEAIIQAYEIQGVLALSMSCHEEGFDHVYFVKIATSAVITKLLGGSFSQIADAVSQSWIDAGPLRTYRHGPTTGSRKSWAAGDATARGAFLSYLTMRGEMGYKEALSAKEWGVSDVLFKGKEIALARPLKEYVIDHILFKVRHPAEFHAQTAVEAALELHPQVKNRLDDIEKIEIHTHASAIKIIHKEGKLKNPADRDHCLQYMIAIPLIYGLLTAKHYEEEIAQDPRIDTLRKKMIVLEDTDFSKDYHHEEKRSIANAIKIYFKDGTSTEKIVVEYPLGHKKRREEAKPYLLEKLSSNVGENLAQELWDYDKISDLNVDELMDILWKKSF